MVNHYRQKKSGKILTESLEVRCGQTLSIFKGRVNVVTTSPSWMHETSARTWCTRETQRDRVEREVGGGIGMGNV